MKLIIIILTLFLLSCKQPIEPDTDKSGETNKSSFPYPADGGK